MNTVHVVQPTSVTTTQVTVMRGNEWSSGICDCCEDCGICCCGFWCFPCLQCQTASDFGECLCLPLMDPMCMGYLGCSAVCPPASLALRTGMRERYKIPGSICNDCCTLYWCFSCSWCQMARELKKRKQPFSIVTAQTTTVPMPQYNYGVVQAVQQPM